MQVKRFVWIRLPQRSSVAAFLTESSKSPASIAQSNQLRSSFPLMNWQKGDDMRGVTEVHPESFYA